MSTGVQEVVIKPLAGELELVDRALKTHLEEGKRADGVPRALQGLKNTEETRGRALKKALQDYVTLRTKEAEARVVHT